MTTSEFIDHVVALDCARFPLIYVQTSAERRALHTLQQAAARRKSQFWSWSLTQGWAGVASIEKPPFPHAEGDPQAALETILKLDPKAPPAMFVLVDFDPFLEDAGIVRRLRDCDTLLRTRLHTVLLTSPRLVLPPHLATALHVLDFPLPDRAVFEELITGSLTRAHAQSKKIAPGMPDDLREMIARSLSGLTHDEAENILALSLVTRRQLDPALIAAQKTQIIRKSDVLEMVSTTDRLEDVGGHDHLKAWLREAQLSFSDKARAYGIEPVRATLFAGRISVVMIQLHRISIIGGMWSCCGIRHWSPWRRRFRPGSQRSTGAEAPAGRRRCPGRNGIASSAPK